LTPQPKSHLLPLEEILRPPKYPTFLRALRPSTLTRVSAHFNLEVCTTLFQKPPQASFLPISKRILHYNRQYIMIRLLRNLKERRTSF
jgi:hypothetical protein